MARNLLPKRDCVQIISQFILIDADKLWKTLTPSPNILVEISAKTDLYNLRMATNLQGKNAIQKCPAFCPRYCFRAVNITALSLEKAFSLFCTNNLLCALYCIMYLTVDLNCKVHSTLIFLLKLIACRIC